MFQFFCLFAVEWCLWEDDVVAWALLRWEVGSGTFVRSKLVRAPPAMRIPG